MCHSPTSNHELITPRPPGYTHARRFCACMSAKSHCITTLVSPGVGEWPVQVGYHRKNVSIRIESSIIIGLGTASLIEYRQVPGSPVANVPVAENRVTYAVIGNWAE